LKKIESVTLNDAKIQRMDQRGAARLSGICGRLKCCLAFESKTYEELSASMPYMNKEVETKKGRGRVIDVYVLEKKVKVLHADNSYNFFAVDEIKVIEEKR
jgi:cell fate regulator YaaT (PSP1 superfamily)